MMTTITSSKRLPLALVLVGFTVMPLWAQGGAMKVHAERPGWVGTWQDNKDRSIIHLRDGGSNGRILDLDGQDRASIYHATCIVTPLADGQPGRAECVGAGINHAEGFRFLYRNSLTLNADNLQETWEAQHVGGVIKGSAVFTPVATRSR